MNTRLSDIIAPSFYDVHLDIKKRQHTHYWEEGGRGSTKSSFVSIEIIVGMTKNPKANTVVLMKVKDYIRDQAFEQLKWAIDILGVSQYWKINISPLMMTYIPTGQKIIFRGGDDPKKIKGTKFHNGNCEYIWFEEVDAFNGMEELRMIIQSLIRGKDSNPTVFYTFNPPKSIKSWINQEVEQQKLRADTLVHHSTYLTVPKDWLGEIFITEAEHLKRTKPDAYKHEYLGEAIGTGGEIFSNVKTERITDEQINRFDKVRRGLDWGFAVDPFTYVVCHLDSTRRRLYIYYELYKVGLSNRLAADGIKEENKLNKLVIADSAEPKSIQELKDFNINIKGAKKGPGSVEFGIKWLEDLEEIIIDPERCPNASREFTSYELEKDHNGNFKSRYPDRDNHTIDAIRYALEDDMVERKFRVTRV
jgi:PBSX family phage terminase large subunit